MAYQPVEWLRDYLYIPLGGKPDRHIAHYRNLMLTMITRRTLAWRGWTFVLWGFYQGLLLVRHRLAAPLARIGSSPAIA